MEYTAEQINECARDLCFYSDKCNKDCYTLNCETTWAVARLLDKGWRKQNTATSKYTVEQYQRVLARAVNMQTAIDALREMSKKGIYSWTEFGNAMEALYKARDEYMRVQHEIVAETFNT